MVDASMDHGKLPFYDKDTLPLKKPGLAAGVRIVPGGSAIRDGAYLAPGVICMPPMYVNIGAYVGEGSMIDSHALVGSCAQVGARVHVSAAAQIGGVIEPVGALPVIIEDEVLIGGNTGIYEGAIVRARAVIAAGTVLTGSTPVYDLVKGEIIRPTARSSAGRARRRGRRARRARGDLGQGRRVGPVARHAGHRQVPRLAHRHPHGARSVDPVRRQLRTQSPLKLAKGSNCLCALCELCVPSVDRDRSVTVEPVDIVGLTRALVDIDSTTGREGECGRWLADYLRGRGWSVEEQRVDDTRFNVIADSARTHLAPRTPHLPSCSPPTSTASRRSFPAGSKATACSAAAPATRKGILAAQVAAAEQLRRDGESRVGLVFVVGEERGSDGARVANAAIGSGARFLINGEPTDNRLGLATRGILRLKLRASGRAAHSSFPELGESAIDKLIDALIELRAIPLPSDPVLGQTHYTVGLINGGVAPERRLAVGRGGSDVQDDERCGGGAAGGGAAGASRGDRARPRGAAGQHEDRARIRHRRFPVHDRHPVPAGLGRAAAVRSRIDPRRAHRRRVGVDRRADAAAGHYVTLARALLLGQA